MNQPDPSPASWLSRLQRWRWEHGILTGRWTASDVQRHREAARRMAADIAPFFDEPPVPSANSDGAS